MEIVLLIFLWLIAAFAAETHNLPFAIFLIFAGMGILAVRWRSMLSQLREKTEAEAQAAASLVSNLQIEVKHLAQELHLLKSQLAAPPAPQAATTTAERIVEKIVPAPVAAPAQPQVAAETKPTVPTPPPREPAPVASVPKTVRPGSPTSPPVAPTLSPAPVAASTPVEPVIAVRPISGGPAAGERGTPTPVAPIAARTVAPPPPAFRAEPAAVAASRTKSPQKLKKALDLEELVGRNVLPKIGIFFLVLGLVGWIATQWQNIPAIGKDLLLLLAGGLLLGLGIFLERREKYELFGRVLIGGGWSMLFFTAYALYHVSATRVLPEQWTDLVIMLATAGVMVWHTLKYRSQVVTGIAYLLAFSTITISQETVFSLSAGAVLAISLVVLVHRMRWYELEVFGILASYLNHFWFLYPILGMGNQHRMFPQFYWSSALLVFYWAVFRGSYIVRTIASKHEENVSTLAGLLNPFLLLSLMKYQSVHPELAFYALLALGSLEFILGQLPITRRRRAAFLILTTLGCTLMIAAIPFKYSGMHTAVLWLAGAEALLIAGVLVREVAFRRLGMIAGLLTALHILIVDVRPWFERLLNSDVVLRDLSLGILLAFCAAVLFADAHLVELRWKDLFNEQADRWLLAALSYASGLVAFCALWIILPPLAVAVGWAALMFAFAVAGKGLRRIEPTLQALALAVATGFRIFMVNLQANGTTFGHGRLWTVAIVAAIFYSTARFTDIPEIEVGLRAFFQWTATAMVAASIWVELPQQWVSTGWIVLAVLLTLVARKLRLQSLLYQCYALSIAALLMTISVNWPLEQSVGHISLRLITVSIVAGGLYLLAILARPIGGENVGACRMAFNTGAAVLLGGLIWYEAGELWAPVLWSAFATVLLVLWRKLDFKEFFVHSNALALVALFNAYIFNMFSPARLHDISARLITVLLVAAMFYFDAWLASAHKRVEWSAQFSDMYSWGASLLVTTLMWHELRPIDVALAWAIFGIVLFEVGLERMLPSLRWQGGIALVASFTRIFFVNLNAVAEPGHLSPRVYSIVPLAFIYLYVYWRTLAKEEAFGPSRWRQIAPMLFSSLGVAAIAFLIRFETPAPFVVVFWGVLILVLLAAARWAGQAVFLYQAIVLGVCTTVRTMMYNLETPSYFTLGDVRARSVGAVIALFFLALIFSFRLRQSPPADLIADGAELPGLLRRIASRSEQFFFFAAVALLTPLIAIEMAHGEITIGWGVEAVLVFVFALWVGERSFRLCGLGLLLLCLGKLTIDVWNMNTSDRTLSMTVLGAVILLMSFLYNRYREAIRKYL